MLINESLLEHSARDQRKHAVLTAFENLWILPMLLLMNKILVLLVDIDRSQGYCAWVLRILSLVMVNFEAAFLVCTASHE